MSRSDWQDGERARGVTLAPEGDGRWRVTVDDGAPLEIAAEPLGDGRLRLATADGAVIAEVTAAGERRFVRLGTLDFVVRRAVGGRRRAKAAGGGLEAPMPGVVTRVLVRAGDAVTRGQPLVAVEAMKMEHVVRAPRDGRVARVAAVTGQLVQGGVALVELEETAGA